MPKNKSKNKPSNPQPKAEVAEALISEIPDKSELEKPETTKTEERVPEIVSELPPVDDVKVSENDTPKKPKRNRGKKKKSNDKDDIEENQDIKLQEPVLEENKVLSDVHELKNVQEPGELSETIPDVTPAARKKKNKIKQAASNKQQNQTENAAQQELKIAPIEKGEELTDLKIITVVPVQTEELKSKKKNKKKKRTDSERSDKADEVLACTAAFQKLLEGRDDKKDKKELKQEEIKPPEAMIVKEVVKKEQIQMPKEIEGKKCDLSEQSGTKNTQIEESDKNKKKNKKDKNQPPKIETEEKMKSTEAQAVVQPDILAEQTTILSPLDNKVENIAEQKQMKEKEDLRSDNDQFSIEKEISSKPKAKIAKPVDKKRKGKGNHFSIEDLLENQIEKCQIEDKLPSYELTQTLPEEQKEQEKIPKQPIAVTSIKEVEETIQPITEIVETELIKINQPTTKLLEIPETTPVEEKVEIKEVHSAASKTESITIPDEGKNKKRKKSPKPRKQESKSVEKKSEAEITKTDTNIPENPKDLQQTLVESLEDIKGEDTLTTSATKIASQDILIESKNLLKNQIEKCQDKHKLPSCELTTLPGEQKEQIKIQEQSIADVPIAEVENTILTQSQKPTETIKTEEAKIQRKPELLEITETTSIEKNIDTKEVVHSEVSKTELISIPDGGKNKKRKKSPKPQKQEPKFEEIRTEAEIIKTNAPENSKTLQQTSFEPPKEIKEDNTFTKSAVKVPSRETEATLNVEIATVAGTNRTMFLETPDPAKIPDIVKERTPDRHQQSDNILAPNMGSSKKRKKSPKPSKSPSEVKKESEQPSEPTKEIPREQREKTSTSMPSLEDIEIRSIKTDESEGSSCDVVPDVQYPRASSQADDNNNFFIQEITSSDTKPNIPVLSPDIPIVQGSGETPIITPIAAATTISITEVNNPQPTQANKTIARQTVDNEGFSKRDEKLDLKSKVLDVNVGMEELRKSIERSLAELNAIEKSEKDAEEHFAKAQAKLEAISNMASKKNEGKNIGPLELTQQAKTKDKVQLQEEKEKSPFLSKLPTESQKPEIVQDSKETLPSPSKEHIQFDKTAQNFGIKEEVIKTLLEPVITKAEEQKVVTPTLPGTTQVPPVCSARKDNKGKGKKKKGKHEPEQSPAYPTSTMSSQSTSAATTGTKESQENKKEEKSEQKNETTQTQEKGKQQATTSGTEGTADKTQDITMTDSVQVDFEPIENFEDALISNNEANEDDVNKTFEMIANDVVECDESQNPEINITAPTDDEQKNDKDTKDGEKVNPVSQPKNLLGHPDIPARLNKTDYKKEKNKTPNTRQATVKIKDAVPIEVTKESKESQTENKRRFLKDKTVTETISSVINDNEEFIYKYSFRKVFLPSACHVCKKDLRTSRVPCSFCNLIFYCSTKHKDEDYTQHQGFCFAVSTIVHLKDQKHIYADAKDITGHEYRLLRMQMIVSCEKVLKRRLTPWEQEVLLYPRICADVGCREWRQNRLVDCDGCGQIAYCSDNPSHLPASHQRWCKSYSLYHKLVVHQQTRGRLEPRLPSRVLDEVYNIPEKLNEVLASMYEEKIDMTDIQYAALTQIATAPLTAAYCQQLYSNNMNAVYANGVNKKSSFTIHVVGAELQFEADALNKWEVFFLHLRPDIKDLRVVLIGPDLNPSNLPLELLGKVRMCENCRQNKRRVLFDFQDNKTYNEYWSTDFSTPDLVCAFNPSIHRSSVFNGKDTWPATIQCILKLKVPLIITSYTMTELQRDLLRIKECSEVDVTNIAEPKYNAFASVRPDRNFISDDEMPLLFKNFCFSVICGSY